MDKDMDYDSYYSDDDEEEGEDELDEDDHDQESAHDHEKCMVDTDEAQDESCRLMNNLVRGLNLTNYPNFTNCRDIQVSNLVEVNCRLLGLSFREYTPSRRPWDDIEKIILSLRQKYGTSINFAHLDIMLIAQREPTHLLCLLQIFSTICEYYKGRGKSFTQPVTQDLTVLTNSTNASSTTSRSPSSTNVSPVLPSIPEERPSELHESDETEFEVNILIKPKNSQTLHTTATSETPSSTESSFQTPKGNTKVPINRKQVRPTAPHSRTQQPSSKSQYQQNEYAYPSPSSDSEQSPSPHPVSRPQNRIQIQNMDETVMSESPNATATTDNSIPDIRINIDFDETRNSEASMIPSFPSKNQYHSKSKTVNSSNGMDVDETKSSGLSEPRSPNRIQIQSIDETATSESPNATTTTAYSTPDIRINIVVEETRNSGSSILSSVASKNLYHSKSKTVDSSVMDGEQTINSKVLKSRDASKAQMRAKGRGILGQPKQFGPSKSSDIADICETQHGSNSKPIDTDSLTQLNKIHDHIQQKICNKLHALEKEIDSLKSPSKSKNIKSCCEEKVDGKGSSRLRSGIPVPSTSKTNNTKPHSKAGGFLHRYSSKSKSKIRHDYFGKPYKEKFPYFPGGLIKPRCHSPPKSKSTKPTSTPRHWTKQQNDKFCQNLYKLLGLPEGQNENPACCSNVLVDDSGKEIAKQQQQQEQIPAQNDGENE